MINSQVQLDAINSPMRHIRAKVALYNGATKLYDFNSDDYLKSFSIERVGESKFFGYGIIQKANVKLLDINRELDINTSHSFRIYLSGDGTNYVNPYPLFYVTEVNRDEKTNELSITAYDKLRDAAKHTVGEINIQSYTIGEFAAACASLLDMDGYEVIDVPSTDTSFATSYIDGANFNGDETIRDALDDIAEATQTIYFTKLNKIYFKRLSLDSTSVYAATKARYFELDSKTNRRLQTIVSATELGDNVSVSTSLVGSTQYVRDNAFWALREDLASLLDKAIAAVGNLSINQFNMKWRGNYLLEVGDKLTYEDKEGTSQEFFLLDDVVSYDGTFSETTQWKYDDEAQEHTNSNTIGEALNQTFARVDKVNKEITLLVSENQALANSISSLQMNTEGINASVQSVEKTVSDALTATNESITTLTEKVNATMTSEQVRLEIQSELDDGVSKVTTHTGFTFDDSGLNVSKSGSEMTTQITEDGMTVSKNNQVVLTANNIGVNAVNLHATTYLIIGTNSRFEDYGNRTGCFWIGG